MRKYINSTKLLKGKEVCIPPFLSKSKHLVWLKLIFKEEII